MAMLESTGCQSATGRIRRGKPVLFGKISENVRLHTLLRLTGCRRQAADDCRLAACAPRRSAIPKPRIWQVRMNFLA
jgi:hypothetical protein